jgi:hypothetical protein
VPVLRREIQFPFLICQIMAETFVCFFFYRTEGSPLVEVVRHGQKNSNKDLGHEFFGGEMSDARGLESLRSRLTDFLVRNRLVSRSMP